MASVFEAHMASALATGSPDLQAMEDRFERRMAELELRHQRHLDGLIAKRDKDALQLEEATSVVRRCEQDLEVFSEWRRDASARLSSTAAQALKAETTSTLAVQIAERGIDESQQTTQALTSSQEQLEEQHRQLAEEVAGLRSLVEDLSKSSGTAQGVEDLDVQDLFARSPWAKSLDRAVIRSGEELKQVSAALKSLEDRTVPIERKLEDQHTDLRELHVRWGADAAQRAEIAIKVETRINEFATLVASLAEDVQNGVGQQKAELKGFFEEELKVAMKDVAPCNAACATLHEALESQMTQLHGERAAMRRAWDRVESLRKDETWGYFLRNDQEHRKEWSEWRADFSRRLIELEEEVTQGSQAVWPEIGHLGCRVADLHAIIDERVPPKDDKESSPAPSPAKSSATSRRASPGNGVAARKAAPQRRSPERSTRGLVSSSAKAHSVSGSSTTTERRSSPAAKRPVAERSHRDAVTRNQRQDDGEAEIGRPDESVSATAKRIGKSKSPGRRVADAEVEEIKAAGGGSVASLSEGRGATDKDYRSVNSASGPSRADTPPRRSHTSSHDRIPALRARVAGIGRISPASSPKPALQRHRRAFAEEDLSSLIPDMT